MKEKLFFNCEMRAEQTDKGAVIEGRPIVFDSRTNMGDFEEVISRSALEKCDLKDVLFFVNHDFGKIPLARSRNNNENSTMQLMPDGLGLKMRAVIDTENNETARALKSAVSRGDITGMSFCFAVAEGGDEWIAADGVTRDKPLRIINDIETIIEVSAVNFPAYEMTEINARSLPEGIKKTLDSVNRSNAPEGAEKNKALEKERLNAVRRLALRNLK